MLSAASQRSSPSRHYDGRSSASRNLSYPCPRAAGRGLSLLVWDERRCNLYVLPLFCITPFTYSFISCLLSFNLSKTMHYIKKTPLDEHCFLAQLLLMYQTLFHTFIFRKFSSLPNSLNQPEQCRTHVTKLNGSTSINAYYLGSP